MLKDNQLSTVLLLVALGFLIYYLAKPCPAAVAATTSVAGNNVDYESESETELATTPSKVPRQAQEQPRVESVSNKVKEGFAEVAQSGQTETRSGAETEGEAEVRVESTESNMGVFNFEGNDVQEPGADLDVAFERPLPQGAGVCTVDINRNNVRKYDAKDFLPKEVNDEWFDTDFSQAKYNINDDKLINTDRYVIGVNTVGQSLKNASYDIRGTIPNPKFTVSPWNNSTYEADYNLRSLC